MDQNYRRGWQKYSFEHASMREVRAHGAEVAILAASAFNRGPGNLQMSLLEVPPTVDKYAIGLHVHRDVVSGQEVEEIYLLVEGEGVMTFTNGDDISMRAGDVVTTYPGTGHAFQATGTKPARLVVIVPEAFRTDRPTAPHDEVPVSFHPDIEVTDCDPSSMTPLRAQCAHCDAEWFASGIGAGGDLPAWARRHPCDS